MLGSAQSRVTIPPERERYDIDAKLFDWSDEITADYPRKEARKLNDQRAVSGSVKGGLTDPHFPSVTGSKILARSSRAGQ
jgi:hypothetical protein